MTSTTFQKFQTIVDKTINFTIVKKKKKIQDLQKHLDFHELT